MKDWGSCLKQVEGTADKIPTLECIFPLVQNIVFWAFILAGITAVVFIIWGGIKFITSRGDQKQVQGARQILTYAIIGLILILSSYIIVALLANLTGVGCIVKFGFTNCR